MFSRKSRLTKVMIAFLLFTLIFSFNAIYAITIGEEDQEVLGPAPIMVSDNFTGSLKTTDKQGKTVNGNQYNTRKDVYLMGDNFQEGSKLWVRVTNSNGSEIYGVSSTAVIPVNNDGKFGPVSLWNAVDGYDYYSGVYKVWVSSSQEFKNDESKTDNFKVINEPGRIQITKADQDSQPQAGVTFTLSGNGIEGSLTDATDEDGIASFSDLAPGTYTLTETVPEGYTSSLGDPAVTSVEVVAGEETKVNVLNSKIIVAPVFGTVEITKLNEKGLAWDGGKVEFIVYTKNSETNQYDKILSGFTSTEDGAKGKLLFEGLDLSNNKTYYLSEVIPNGYLSTLNAYTPIKFEEYFASIEITNKKISGEPGEPGEPEEPITPTPEEPVTTPPEGPSRAEELPKTGGSAAAYLLRGAVLTGMGILLRRLKR